MIGAGNVSTHISRHFHSKGHRIFCVYSRNSGSATELAGELGAMGTNIPDIVPDNADFYIVCVPDSAVAEVVGTFSHLNGTWLHTAGALSMDLFEGNQSHFGVLYPLQTLSKNRQVDLKESPFLVEGSSPEVTALVKTLASSISNHVHEVDSATRLSIHLSAVFANNFSNHMVTIGQQLMREKGVDENLLNPILEETFKKMAQVGAKGAQTGPAIRKDLVTMQKHIELLKDHPEWEKLYTFISREIDRSREE